MALKRSNVVPLAGQDGAAPEPIRHPATVDLRGNNRFHDLLESYVEESNRLYDAKRKKERLYGEIVEMLGGAEEAEADQFYVRFTAVVKPEQVIPEHIVPEHVVPEHVVPEQIIPGKTTRYLRVRRKGR